MFYTSGTTGRPKGTVRRPRDPASVVPLSSTSALVEDDVYLTTGRSITRGPGGLAGAHLLGDTAVFQRRFERRSGWPGRDVPRQHDVLGADADPPGRGTCPPVKARYDRRHAADDRQRRAVAVRAQELRRGLQRRLAVGGLRLDRARRRHGARRRRTSGASPARAAGPAPASRSSSSTRTARRSPSRTRRASLRAQRQQLRHYHKAHGQVRRRAGAATSSPSATSRTTTTKVLYICDRKSDMVISGGMNIYPAEIEAALVRHRRGGGRRVRRSERRVGRGRPRGGRAARRADRRAGRLAAFARGISRATRCRAR